MGWRDLLETKGETIILPWVGGRSLRFGPRAWHIEGELPSEHSWVEFRLDGREARVLRDRDPEPSKLIRRVTGYLIGDRLMGTHVRVDLDARVIAAYSERVFLLDPYMDRFALISAGRFCEDGPLVFIQQEMPLGPEAEVQSAYLDDKPSVDDVPGVTPALDAAFRMARWQRVETERRRVELEEQRRVEEELRQREARRREIIEKLGDGAGRREMAVVDFEAAARAALAVGGATYLEHRASRLANEMVVRFRLDGQRFECTCDRHTLRIIDAGICLTAHGDDDEFAYGTKGDTFFTLESLCGVILEAQREGKLVVFRHVN
jgi:PAS domain-containing protein